METLDNVPAFLQKHPLLGIISGLMGSSLHFINILSPILSFIGLVLGIGIAAITLHLKVLEWKEKRKERTNKNNETE